MLRRTLCCALERKGNRPIMAKAHSLPGRPRPSVPAATLVAAGEPIFPGDELNPPPPAGNPHSLRQLRGRRLPTAARGRGGAADVTSHRRVMEHRPGKLSRAAAGATTAAEVAEEDIAEQAVEYDAEDDEHVVTVAGEAEDADAEELDEEGDDEEALPEAASAREVSQPRRVAPSTAGTPAASPQHSKEAYRFLLDHIDAEIAALQRRHTTVTTRRQRLEERNTHRVKELFDFMENPWKLLPTDVQPPLPATGVDVYLKEQRAKRAGEQDSGMATMAGGHHDAQDKMFVLACHKNFRSLPSGEKRYYEQAAGFNAAVRQELKYRLATGCSRFEAFCQQVKECTADMARAGQVPELPATWAHSGGHTSRYQGLSKWQRNARQAADAAAAGAADDVDEEAGAIVGGSGKRRGGGASRKVKAVAEKAKKVAAEAAVAAAPAEVSSGQSTSVRAKGKGKGQGNATAKSSVKRAAAAKSKKAAPKKAGTSSRSASIPLPDLDKLAIRKLKKAIAPLTGRNTSGKASKPTPKAATKMKKK